MGVAWCSHCGHQLIIKSTFNSHQRTTPAPAGTVCASQTATRRLWLRLPVPIGRAACSRGGLSCEVWWAQ